MQTYELVTVEAQINGHKTAAVAFLELAEADIHRLDIKADTVETLYTLSVPVRENKASDIARRFFYEMSQYHTKQKIRWEMIRDGNDPDAVIGKTEIIEI
jgi:hypothetical protein